MKVSGFNRILDPGTRRRSPFLVGDVGALASLIAQCEGERRGEIRRVGGRELVGGFWHRDTIAEARERNKNLRATILIVAMLLTGPASAQSPDISARRLLSSWKGDDPSMKLVAEVIARALLQSFA